MTKKMYTLFSGNNVEELELAVKYLTNEIRMCQDFPPKVVENIDKQNSWDLNWLVVVPESCKEYTQTINKIRGVLRDYLSGLKLGIEKGRQAQIEYEAKLKEWQRGKTRLTHLEQNRLFTAINILVETAHKMGITRPFNCIEEELLRLVAPRVPRYLKGLDIERQDPNFDNPKTQLRMWKTILKRKTILKVPTADAQKVLVECEPARCEKCTIRLKCMVNPK